MYYFYKAVKIVRITQNMELPNIYFQDFPVDFKQINSHDFPHFKVNDKAIISPNDEGYISEALKSNIKLDEKNTVVINAAVGQGKTTAILDIVKEYYENTDYMIFIASPFVSLVEQYYQKSIELGIPENDIYRYELIGKDMTRDAWDSRIQIVTANCLLGNPGEDSLTSSDAKRNYLNYLSKKCEQTGKKAIFIYDEIHDTIHNFQQKLIFNLYKWKNVIHKNFLLSATYNEASKVVIEYLAELTDKKIQIIESERKIFPEKQSDLYLHFNGAQVYKYDNDDIVQIVQNLIDKGKKIDILSFSKILANDICSNIDKGVGKILYDSYGDIHNCTSDLNDNARIHKESPKNRYDASKCNVGTNFKTGVSIEKDDHALIIIMPPLGRKGSFKNKYGIFSDGVNSIIQALARQRVKGEIHIILPPPDKFDYDTLPFSDLQKDKFTEYYKVCENFKDQGDKLVKYYSFDQQDELLKEYYKTVIYDNIKEQDEYIKTLTRKDLPALNFPSYKDYKLSDGEDYFTKYHKFFGSDLSSFILYSALTNQFVNCRLVGVNIKPVLYFEEGKIQWKLTSILKDYFDKDYFNYLKSTVSDSYFYSMLKNEIFSQYKVLLKSSESNYKEIQANQNKYFEQQLLAFTQKTKHIEDRLFISRFLNGKLIIDVNFSRGEYFRNCISLTEGMSEEANDISGEQKALVEAYKTLNHFRHKMINNVASTGRGIRYLPNEPFENFIEDSELEKFNHMIEVLINNDPIISKEIYDFKNTFIRSDYTEEMKIKAFYNYLKTDFFRGGSKRINNSDLNANVYEILQIENIPKAQYVLNLIENKNFIIDESNFPELIIDDNGNFYIKQKDGSLEKFEIV